MLLIGGWLAMRPILLLVWIVESVAIEILVKPSIANVNHNAYELGGIARRGQGVVTIAGLMVSGIVGQSPRRLWFAVTIFFLRCFIDTLITRKRQGGTCATR